MGRAAGSVAAPPGAAAVPGLGLASTEVRGGGAAAGGVLAAALAAASGVATRWCDMLGQQGGGVNSRGWRVKTCRVCDRDCLGRYRRRRRGMNSV